MRREESYRSVFLDSENGWRTRSSISRWRSEYHVHFLSQMLTRPRGTPSPTIDPSVHTILVGHSMGGIVAAETLIALANERPIPPSASQANPDAPNFPSNTTLDGTTSTSRPNPILQDTDPVCFMFPHVQGLLAFDTPFLGLESGMFAHSLEGGQKAASSAFQTYSEIASMFGRGGKSEATAAIAKPSAGALPAPATGDAAAAPKWQSWGKYAMFAGAAGAVAAGGAAALYSQRDKISAGWGWASSHLLFVGDLVKAEHLRKRVESVSKICTERELGAANLYTNLGRGAKEDQGPTDTVAGRQRTFCNLPSAVKEGRDKDSKKHQLKWIKAVNDKAKDEATAHMNMFSPKENPGFYVLAETAKEIIIKWVDQGWYQGSENKPANGDAKDESNLSSTPRDDWEGLDGTHEHDENDELQMREEAQEEAPNQDEEMLLEGSVIVDKSPTNDSMMEMKASKEDVPLPQNA